MKRKKKKKRKGTRGAGGPGRATAHFGSSIKIEKLCRDRVSHALCRNRGPRPRARYDLGMLSRRARAVRRTHDSSPVHVTELSGSMSRHGLPMSQ